MRTTQTDDDDRDPEDDEAAPIFYDRVSPLFRPRRVHGPGGRTDDVVGNSGP